MDGEAASVVTKDARLASFDQYRTEWEAEMRSMEVANQSAADAEAGRMVSGERVVHGTVKGVTGVGFYSVL